MKAASTDQAILDCRSDGWRPNGREGGARNQNIPRNKNFPDGCRIPIWSFDVSMKGWAENLA
jgi:hypothetical protein